MRAQIAAVACVVALGLSGCGHVLLFDSNDVALYQSAEQRLVVHNSTAKTLSIAVNPSGPPISLAPGASMTRTFRVDTIGTVRSPKGGLYWTIDPTGRRPVFLELGSPRVVDASSPALTLRFRDEAGTPVVARFALNLCGDGPGWSRPDVPAADHRIEAPDPIPAIPQAVCP